MGVLKHIDFQVPGFGEFAAGPQLLHRYASLVLEAGPVAWWRLDESDGVTAADAVSGLDATYQPSAGGAWLGGTQAVAGLFPYGSTAAARFDGTGYCAVPSSDLINTAPAYDRRTTAAWFSVDDAQADWQVIFEEGGYVSGINLYVHQGRVYGCLWSSTHPILTLSAPIQRGAAYFFVTVFDAPAMTFTAYLNGVSIGQVSLPGDSAMPTHAGAVHIAKADRTTNHLGQGLDDKHFAGVIDQVMLYNAALDAATIRSIYLAATEPPPVLAQTSDGAFVDRPAAGEPQSLQFHLAPGPNVAFLEQDLGGDRPVLASRLLVNAEAASGGAATLLDALDSSETPLYRVVYDAVLHRVSLCAADADPVGHDLVGGLAWHCIETRLNAGAPSLTLHVNGRLVAQAPAVTVPVRSLRLGAMDKQTDLAGSILIDEWIIADEPIGVVTAKPRSEHADDPARWLVIYNTASADSVAWAEHYRSARGVPYGNLLGLPLSTGETVAAHDLLDLQSELTAYLADNDPQQAIMGIVLGFGVPGYAVINGWATPISPMLQCLDGDDEPIANPLAGLRHSTRPTRATMQGRFLVARVDAPALVDAIAMVDRATALMTDGPGDGADATVWLDAVTPGPVYASMQQTMIDWSQSVDAQALRLPLIATAPADPPSEVRFDRVTNDGFFWGFRDAVPSQGFFGDPAGRRVFAAQLNDVTATAPTLRQADDANWASASLKHGYAATIGIAHPITLTAWPEAWSFYNAVRDGWTLAEAWWASSPLWRAGVMFIGDPLLKVELPLNGWNVYGPFTDWAGVRFDQPAAMTRESSTRLPLQGELLPADGSPALYVVRHVDSHGRESSALKHVRRVYEDGVMLRQPELPLWPGDPDWRPQQHDAAWRIHVFWASAMDRSEVERVLLLTQRPGEAAVVAHELTPPRDARQLAIDHVPAAEPLRLALRLIGPDGGVVQTTWSAWLTRTTVAPRNLKPIPPESAE